MLKSRPQKLLIIDEVNYTRFVLSQVLSSKGYKVGTAQNSGEAMQSITAELPDVILLSLRGTDSAVSALRNLKDYFRLRLDVAQGAEPAIIILSDLRDTRQTREVMSLGVSHSLARPVNIQELFNSVSSVISSNRTVSPEKRVNIIFIDSETRSQQFLESILTHEVYDIEAANSEAEFLENMKVKEYDLAIMDLSSFDGEMPEILANIGEIAKEMPVITIATSADQVSQDELKELGVHAHFIKPLHTDLFRAEVDTLLQTSEAEEEEQGEPQEEQTEESEETVADTDQESDHEKEMA